MGHALREDEVVAQTIVDGAEQDDDAVIVSLYPTGAGRLLVCVEAPYADTAIFHHSRIDAVCDALQSLKARVPVTPESAT